MSELPESFRSKIAKQDRLPFGKEGVTNSEAKQKCDDRNEKELQRQIEDYLRQRDIRYVCRSRMDRRTTNAKGTPDFIFCFASKFVALEVKVGNNQLSSEQARAILDIIHNGGIAEVVRSLERVKQILDYIELSSTGLNPLTITED